MMSRMTDHRPPSEPPWQAGPPPVQEPSSDSRPLAWIAALLLLVIAFLGGMAIGQSGAFGGGGTAVVPTVTPADAATPPPAVTPPAATPPTDGTSPPASPAPPLMTPPPVVTQPPGPPATQPPGAPANFGLFWEALEVIRENFVGRDELDDQTLTYGAIEGLVEALGDTGHTIFLTPEALQRERESLQGTIVGVGALLGERDGRPVIVSVVSGGPASRAGVRSGDFIQTVDGESVEELPPEEIASRVRGEEGTTVVITVLRPQTDEVIEFSIVREEIRFPAADWTMVPGTDIAILRLIQFSEAASEELRQARDDALAAGAGSFILDLRSNPGGFVHEAVRVASLFLPADETVYIRELADGERIPVAVEDGFSPTDLPLVVLIDLGTASSAEIVSGALRSAGRGPLVGETTFGTGTVLLTYELSDGSAVRLAVERWLTPDGELIFDRGISPTEELVLGPEERPLEPDEVEGLDPAAVPTIEDAQLRRAIEILGGLGP
jgi:carboxyl-terminal processing protease